jgi:hypothetical protein
VNSSDDSFVEVIEFVDDRGHAPDLVPFPCGDGVDDARGLESVERRVNARGQRAGEVLGLLRADDRMIDSHRIVRTD